LLESSDRPGLILPSFFANQTTMRHRSH